MSQRPGFPPVKRVFCRYGDSLASTNGNLRRCSIEPSRCIFGIPQQNDICPTVLVDLQNLEHSKHYHNKMREKDMHVSNYRIYPDDVTGPHHTLPFVMVRSSFEEMGRWSTRWQSLHIKGRSAIALQGRYVQQTNPHNIFRKAPCLVYGTIRKTHKERSCTVQPPLGVSCYKFRSPRHLWSTYLVTCLSDLIA